MPTCRSLLPVLLALSLLVIGCRRETPTPTTRPPRPVLVAEAVARDVPLYLTEVGKCAAFETVMIQPQISGAITKIHFKDGAEVQKGDLLFTIDPRPFQAALQQAEASLEINRAKAAYDEAQLKRNKDLRQSNAVALQALDNAVANARASAAAVTGDLAALETAKLNLEYCNIRAPISGRAGRRLVDVGNVVEANKAELLLLQRQDPIYVDFFIPENELHRLRKFKTEGILKVEASFPDDPETRREGELDFLDSGVQENAGVIRLRAILKNEDRLFWPGQFVNVRLLLDTLKASTLVPQEAVQTSKRGPYVYVVKDDLTVEMRLVKPGQRHGDEIVLLEGVKPGERVVTTGQIALAPGAAVTLAEARP